MEAVMVLSNTVGRGKLCFPNEKEKGEKDLDVIHHSIRLSVAHTLDSLFASLFLGCVEKTALPIGLKSAKLVTRLFRDSFLRRNEARKEEILVMSAPVSRPSNTSRIRRIQ